MGLGQLADLPRPSVITERDKSALVGKCAGCHQSIHLLLLITRQSPCEFRIYCIVT